MNSELERQIAAATACFQVPNETDSFTSFVELILEDYLAVSAGAYEQQANPGTPQHPVWMWPVDGQSIQIYPFWTGSPYDNRYRQSISPGIQASLAGIDLADIELVYIAPNPSTHTPFGYGPLEVTAASINRQLGAGEFAGNVASNAQPENMLWMGNVDTGTLNAFRTFWRNEVEGQGQTPIVGGPDEPKAVRLVGGSDDALYLKWQEFLIREIATGFGLSIQNFGLQRVGGGVGGADADDRDWESAIKPTAQTLQDYFTRQTIWKLMGFSQLQFQYIGLDREEELDQANIHELQYQNNIILPSEARKQLGMPPSDNRYMDMTYAEVQVEIGEARRGNAASQDNPSKLHNLPAKKVRQLR